MNLQVAFLDLHCLTIAALTYWYLGMLLELCAMGPQNRSL